MRSEISFLKAVTFLFMLSFFSVSSPVSVSMAGLDPVILRQQSPPSLKVVPVPEPANLSEYVIDKPAAIALGKALFWDMQVGSDGIQACASCHFHAGADRRAKNQLGPGLNAGDTTFQSRGPNSVLRAGDFPFHDRANPEFQTSPIIRNINDVASSVGIFLSQFVDITPGSSIDQTTFISDTVFNVAGTNTRRVEPRNAPTAINAVFNFANFWDGRANNIFNGVNPFGPADLSARIWANNNEILEQVPTVGLNNASLASQAVGPPGSEFEMSARGRPFRKIGKKMLSLPPLAKQKVSPADSVLGAIAAPGKGLTTTYPQMIQQSFNSKYWNSTGIIVFNDGVPSVLPGPGRALTTDEFTQMEANFSLFFGLAVQLYEATLVSDETPFDRFALGDDTALTEQQMRGLDTFLHQGKCINCHGGAEFTNASVTVARFLNNSNHGLFEIVPQVVQGNIIYDEGYYNIGLVPTTDDLSRGGTAPFVNSFTGSAFPLSFISLAVLQNQHKLPFSTPQLSSAFPIDFIKPISNGRFKAGGLRNVELTGPYFHNGGAATLEESVDFYIRGGNFPQVNIFDLDPDIAEIIFLQGEPERAAEMVAFLKALTDERVRQEMAPFDHPQLFVPNGHPGDNLSLNCSDAGYACDSLLVVPAVGQEGRPAAGLLPLGPFLGVNPAPQKIGVAAGGAWYIDLDGNNAWDGAPTDLTNSFGAGLANAVYMTGDWTGTGTANIGVYSDGLWFLDANGSGTWDGAPVDAQFSFGTGLAGALPVVGDWNGTGAAKIGVYSDGVWYLDINGNGTWDGTPVDAQFSFGTGLAGALPVAGDWNGTGTAKIGVYSDGLWYLDVNGSGTWDGTPTDAQYSFGAGLANALPVVGDWNGAGRAKIGVFSDGAWYLDLNGNGAYDGTAADDIYTFGVGLTGATPVAGTW
jgi:cytochrome c peroxidase